LLRDGTLLGWGNSDWGQIGAGVSDETQLHAVMPKISGVRRVWAGGNNSFALTRDRRFWSWGGEQSGKGLLGTQSKTPVALYTCLAIRGCLYFSNWSHIAAVRATTTTGWLNIRSKAQFLTSQRVVVTQVIMLMPVETAHDLLGPRHFIQCSKAMWMATRRLMRHQNIGT
jgi:alpha-tubulin suppressor-like RCC1 family protein